MLQESSFNKLEDARWAPMDQRTVNDELNAVRADISRFAKAHAADSFDGIKDESPDTQHRLWGRLKKVVRFRPENPSQLDELSEIPHGPRLCLTALLSHYIHFQVLDKPFFFLDAWEAEQSTGTESQDNGPGKQVKPNVVFEKVYNYICGYDVKQGNVWRSDTIRLLNPDRLAKEGSAEGLVGHTGQMVEDASLSLSRAFHEKVENRILFRSQESYMSPGLVKELDQIFLKAGQLAMRLWAQRPRLRLLRLRILRQRPFIVGSDCMEPHPLHKLDDPQDHRLDGRLTKVVVHPAVQAEGTHSADHYEQRQTWAKAVVWLDGKESCPPVNSIG